MEMLDLNEIESVVEVCGEQLRWRVWRDNPQICGLKLYGYQCSWKLKCPTFSVECRGILQCGRALEDRLTRDLKACGDGFYIKCPGFDRIERYCEFEPAIDAAKWREAQLDKVAELEARIERLELEPKKKG